MAITPACKVVKGWGKNLSTSSRDQIDMNDVEFGKQNLIYTKSETH